MRLTANRIAVAICLYYVVLGIAFAWETPAFEAQDEGAHFLYIHNLIQTGKLPVLEDRKTVFASRSVERHQPPLYYMIGAGLVAWTNRSDVDDYFQPNPFASIGFVKLNNQNVYLHDLTPRGGTLVAVWILRLYTLALATGALWLIYRAGQIAFPGRPVGLLALALTVSIPGFVANGVSISNDSMVTFLFAAGVAWSLSAWRRGSIDQRDLFMISVILPFAALSKLTGAALYPLVYGALGLAALTHRLSWRAVFRVVVVSLAASVLIAGWWYFRNWQLYGDPLALEATLRIWGRGKAVSVGLSEVLFEAKGVWDSFWMTLGHFNIRGPEWLYGYVAAITLAGIAGLVVALRRVKQRTGLLVLLATVGVIIAALITSTAKINVSQGRILYPALIGFAPLMALGWQSLLGRRLGTLLFVPLAVVTLVTPIVYLDWAYPDADPVSVLPPDATILNVRSESLTIVGYRLQSEAVDLDGPVELEVYFSGRHPANPALFVKALDPTTQETLGSIDFYPGMLPTSDLTPGVIYSTEVEFPLDPSLTRSRAPLNLSLALGWRVLTPEPGRFLPLVDSNGNKLGILSVDGPTLVNLVDNPPDTRYDASVTFGSAIRLNGYTLNSSVAAGGVLPVTLGWDSLAEVNKDYTLTVGMVDASGKLVAQTDGMIPGYPTSQWQVGESFVRPRPLRIPATLPPGSYTLYVGWYLLPDVTRLPAQGDSVRDNLYFLPTTITVTAPQAAPAATANPTP